MLLILQFYEWKKKPFNFRCATQSHTPIIRLKAKHTQFIDSPETTAAAQFMTHFYRLHKLECLSHPHRSSFRSFWKLRQFVKENNKMIWIWKRYLRFRCILSSSLLSWYFWSLFVFIETGKIDFRKSLCVRVSVWICFLLATSINFRFHFKWVQRKRKQP